MSHLSRLTAIAAFALATSVATPSLAFGFGTTPGPCTSQSQLVNSINLLIPRNIGAVDPAALSCSGQVQVYSLLTRSRIVNEGEQRRRILAVFRREGLIR